MAEVDGQEKTEQATGKKVEDTREKGQVAKSTEINSFAIVTVGLMLIFMMQKHLASNVGGLATTIFSDVDKLKIDKDFVVLYAIKGLSFFVVTVGPLFLGLIVVSIISNYGQVGFKFTPKAFMPKFSKFNPFTNIKSIFFSTRSLVEVAKSIVKLVIISIFTYSVLKDFVMTALGLVNYPVSEVLTFMMEASYTLIIKISIVYALIAASDFAFQRYKYKQDLMMTKQEVKEEMLSSEGNPQIKGKIKSIQIKMARNRMMKDVPKADVVITNPTHFAVALKYDYANDPAPKVVAKGMDELAQKIKKIAAENNVPIHEDKMLARALYKHCEVGDEIPADLFKAVAQILAYIYKIKNEKKRKLIV